LPDAAAWTHTALLAAEKNAIGFYITGHPLENYSEILKEFNSQKALDLSGLETGSKVNLGGVLMDLQVRTTKKGSRFGLMRLEDETASVKCVMWPEVFSKYESFLQNDTAVLICGKLEITDNGSVSLIADEVARLADVLQRKARAVLVRLPWGGQGETQLGDLFGLLDKHRGDCDVLLEMCLEGGVLVRARTHGTLRVRGSVELETALRQQGCQVEWLNVTL
jgi:DNA polymerase-3 subunit alpha